MEVPVKSNAFQIKPDLEKIIPPAEVKKIIQQVLNETLLSELNINFVIIFITFKNYLLR